MHTVMPEKLSFPMVELKSQLGRNGIAIALTKTRQLNDA